MVLVWGPVGVIAILLGIYCVFGVIGHIIVAILDPDDEDAADQEYQAWYRWGYDLGQRAVAGTISREEVEALPPRLRVQIQGILARHHPDY